MADELKDDAKPKKEGKAAEALCPPFQIISKTVVLGDEAFKRGDEYKLRPLLDKANFESLVNLKAIARL